MYSFCSKSYTFGLRPIIQIRHEATAAVAVWIFLVYSKPRIRNERVERFHRDSSKFRRIKKKMVKNIHGTLYTHIVTTHTCIHKKCTTTHAADFARGNDRRHIALI